MLLLPVAVAAPIPCGTPRPPAPPAPDPSGSVATVPPPDGKAERDAYGAFPHGLSSANVVVKWGDEALVDPADAAALLDAFEAAWAVEVGTLGHPAPVGTDAYLLNVYIGDTGSGAPSGRGANGWYDRDPDGYPMIVVARGVLDDLDLARETSAHELYHALQDRVNAYPDADGTAWYWEATANWAAGEVWPDNPHGADTLAGYAFYPWLPLDGSDFASVGVLATLHAYGAFVFPRFLTEQVADPSIVVDSWVDPGDAADPMAALTAALADRGLAMEDVFASFAAHDAVWDYAAGDAYAAALEAAADQWGSGYSPLRVVNGDSGGTVEAPAALLPGGWAYNLVDIDPPRSGGVRIGFEGDATGSEGAQARWRTVLVRTRGSTHTYVPFDGELEVPDLSGDDADVVAIASTAPDAGAEERFGWRYAVDPVEASSDAPDPGESPECGCSSGAPSVGSIAAVLAAMLADRRVRSLRRDDPPPAYGTPRRRAETVADGPRRR